MRGRDNAGNTGNPLARRFHPDDEPDTIDLQEHGGFNAEAETDEPETSPARPAPTGDASTGAASTGAAPTMPALSVVTLVPGTGKFYVQPGQGESLTYLGDTLVRTQTELRHGDRIRVGDFELQILPAAGESRE